MNEAEAVKHATSPVEETWLKERHQELRSHPISFERLRRMNPDVVHQRIRELQQHLLEYSVLYNPVKAKLEASGRPLPPDFELQIEVLALMIARAVVENAISLNLSDEQLSIVIDQTGELDERNVAGQASRGYGAGYGVVKLASSEVFSAFREIENLRYAIEFEKNATKLAGQPYPPVEEVMRTAVEPNVNPTHVNLARDVLWGDMGGLTILTSIIAHEMYHVRQLIADPTYFNDTGLAVQYHMPKKNLNDFNGDIGQFEIYEAERVDKRALYTENIGELSARKHQFRYLYYLRRRIERDRKAEKASILDVGMIDMIDEHKTELARKVRAIKENREARGSI